MAQVASASLKYLAVIIIVKVPPICISGRGGFFHATLQCLQQAATRGYEVLQSECKVESARVDSLYPNIPIMDPSPPDCRSPMSDHLRYLKEIFPTEWKPRFYPGEAYPDGNCLYRYV